ncbi:hypothetical protein CROQUDRAFT_499280 [Cronartium quercuum f. sp. fusiforme G11]|uniref:Protein kinase domain-containing protein n=1 Tax=Cronartium quercuum f. sp. fusiforme G11 TaxID=708437 RepID=A0A9P6T5E6_9BASI|nr:hypothetical protein CROQUDRAFT_499280 [Cronartium quercuum f. sp. fusiforme G11]
MVTGKLPFGKVDEPLDLYRSILEDAPEIGEDWEPNLIELICRLLDKDPKSRIKLIEIENCSWIHNSGLLPKLELNKENNNLNIDKKINDTELSKTFKLGLTNTCHGFIEIVKIAKLSNSRKEFLVL